MIAAALAVSGLLSGSPTAAAKPMEVTPSKAPPPQKMKAAADAKPDFNGDGNSDLAIVSIGEKGVVHVMYGSSNGLRAASAQRFTRFNVPTLADVNVYTFGKSLASGDFNGDGYGDLAVGIEKLEVDAEEVSGSLVVLYGSAQGLKAADSQYVTHQSLKEPGFFGSDDRFGWVLAAGDFGRGSASDLAISSAAEGAGGSVHVVYGSASGLSLTDGQVWSRATPGVKGEAQGSVHFGDALVADNFNGAGPDDLAIGAPQVKVGKVFGAGAVHILKGSASGLTAAGDEVWYRDRAGIKGKAAYGDGFGAHLASGHFAGRASADLVVTMLLKNPVSVIFGSSKGLTTSDQLWDSKSKGLPAGSFTGQSSARPIAGNFGHDPSGKKRDDLAICVPGRSGTGAALVLYGSTKGLSASGSKQFRQDTAGIPDVPGDGEGFCANLAAGVFDGNTYSSLAIASQKTFDEDDGQQHVYAPGTVHVLPGSKKGLTVDGVQLWTSDKLGGQPNDSYLFGYELAVAGR